MADKTELYEKALTLIIILCDNDNNGDSLEAIKAIATTILKE